MNHSTPSTIMLCLLALALVLANISCSDCKTKPLRVATTTSTQNSGLMDLLIPVFEKKYGIQVQMLAAGTGQALALGKSGDVDVILVHARKRENQFVAAGHGVNRKDVMWNDFVILGPTNDPARIKSSRLAAVAFHLIAHSESSFLSRGDDSGTHIREQMIWADAGIEPTDQTFFNATGLGMGKSILIADQKQAYILSDRATYLAFRKRIELAILLEGDLKLRNPYGVITVNPSKSSMINAQAAQSFVEFLISTEGQKIIDNYRLDGEQLFHSNDKSS